MTPPSLPFPRTTAALARLNPRQLDFCHRIMAGEYAVRAYAAVWGHTQSGCPRKMAAKIKSGHAVSEYLAARYEELCVRDRISREAGMLAITEWRTGFNKAVWIAGKLDEARQELAHHHRPARRPKQPELAATVAAA